MIYKNLFARKIISFLIISAMILILFPRIPVSADINLGRDVSQIFKDAIVGHFNGHSYVVVYESVTPVEAERKCLELGGYLATITSKEENEFLISLFNRRRDIGYIIGGTDREVEGQWQWMNGEPWTFEYWNGQIEPNDGLGKGEDYVVAGRNVDWKWVDVFGGYDNYSAKFPYVCEFDTMIDGAGQNMQTPQNPPKPQIPQNPQNAMPTPNNAVPVPVESKNGANPTLVFNGVTGVSINSPINRGYLGYRVFRSENEYDLGISVTDFYITSENFTDVNVEPNTTYYYTLKPVISEANPLQNKKEQLGDVIAKWRVTTANSLGTNFGNSNGMRHFIMLKINDPKMSVDGVMQEVDPGKGTTPIIVKGRTMVPIRAIVEAMGGNVGWENSRREVSLSVQGIDVKMWIDKKELIKNSRHTKIDVAPSVINGRTFVPLRFAAENLDCQVDWINSTKSVVIVWSE